MPFQPRAIWVILAVCLLPRWVSAIAQGRDATVVWMSNPLVRVDINLATGLYDCRWTDKSALLDAGCSARLSDGTELTAAACPEHVCTSNDIESIADPLGKGLRVTVHHRKPGSAELRQVIDLYEDQPVMVTSVQIVSPKALATNHIEVVTSDVHLPTAGKPTILSVPFDNDGYVRFNYKHDPAKDPDSYEVSAIYDNSTRRGIVLGSINHDVWKTGINLPKTGEHLIVYGGATGTLSRDSQPHGMVTGTAISSPRIWIGSFADWRDGLEAYGQANAQIHPPLAWKGTAIFGWNSWAAYRDKVNYADYLAASDFLNTKLQPAGFESEKTVYVNWDSFWTNCTEEQLRAAARHAHANGQKGGIYWTPFAAWKPNPERAVEGTGGEYHYRDILLRDDSGKMLPSIDGGQPLDPTHPGTLRRIDWQLARFADWGYDFVKLDFVNFGTVEGKHFDPTITTGVAAYNIGMQRIVADLSPEKIGRPFFISLSIAPLFPSGYAHSRRISCDAFGSLHDSEYMLNSLTYGWWINKTLYSFNDPDHTVLTSAKNPTTLEEARTRLNASIITGSMLIDSDDLTDPAAQQRAMLLLTNPRINNLAKSGQRFRPVEGDTNDHAADTFVSTNPDGSCSVAVFNYDAQKSSSRTIKLDRLGLQVHYKYRMHDLWDDRTSTAQDAIQLELTSRASRILSLTPE